MDDSITGCQDNSSLVSDVADSLNSSDCLVKKSSTKHTKEGQEGGSLVSPPRPSIQKARALSSLNEFDKTNPDLIRRRHYQPLTSSHIVAEIDKSSPGSSQIKKKKKNGEKSRHKGGDSNNFFAQMRYDNIESGENLPEFSFMTRSHFPSFYSLEGTISSSSSSSRMSSIKGDDNDNASSDSSDPYHENQRYRKQILQYTKQLNQSEKTCEKLYVELAKSNRDAELKREALKLKYETEIALLEGKLAQMSNENATQSATMIQLSIPYAQMEEENRHLKVTKLDLENQVSDLQKRVKDLEDDNETTIKKNSELLIAVNEMQDSVNENFILKNECNLLRGVKSENVTLKAQLDNLERQYALELRAKRTLEVNCEQHENEIRQLHIVAQELQEQCHAFRAENMERNALRRELDDMKGDLQKATCHSLAEGRRVMDLESDVKKEKEYNQTITMFVEQELKDLYDKIHENVQKIDRHYFLSSLMGENNTTIQTNTHNDDYTEDIFTSNKISKNEIEHNNQQGVLLLAAPSEDKENGDDLQPITNLFSILATLLIDLVKKYHNIKMNACVDLPRKVEELFSANKFSQQKITTLSHDLSDRDATIEGLKIRLELEVSQQEYLNAEIDWLTKTMWEQTVKIKEQILSPVTKSVKDKVRDERHASSRKSVSQPLASAKGREGCDSRSLTSLSPQYPSRKALPLGDPCIEGERDREDIRSSERHRSVRSPEYDANDLEDEESLGSFASDTRPSFFISSSLPSAYDIKKRGDSFVCMQKSKNEGVDDYKAFTTSAWQSLWQGILGDLQHQRDNYRESLGQISTLRKRNIELEKKILKSNRVLEKQHATKITSLNEEIALLTKQNDESAIAMREKVNATKTTNKELIVLKEELVGAEAALRDTANMYSALKVKHETYVAERVADVLSLQKQLEVTEGELTRTRVALENAAEMIKYLREEKGELTHSIETWKARGSDAEGLRLGFVVFIRYTLYLLHRLATSITQQRITLREQWNGECAGRDLGIAVLRHVTQTTPCLSAMHCAITGRDFDSSREGKWLRHEDNSTTSILMHSAFLPHITEDPRPVRFQLRYRRFSSLRVLVLAVMIVRRLVLLPQLRKKGKKESVSLVVDFIAPSYTNESQENHSRSRMNEQQLEEILPDREFAAQRVFGRRWLCLTPPALLPTPVLSVDGVPSMQAHNNNHSQSPLNTSSRGEFYTHLASTLRFKRCDDYILFILQHCDALHTYLPFDEDHGAFGLSSYQHMPDQRQRRQRKLLLPLSNNVGKEVSGASLGVPDHSWALPFQHDSGTLYSLMVGGLAKSARESRFREGRSISPNNNTHQNEVISLHEDENGEYSTTIKLIGASARMNTPTKYSQIPDGCMTDWRPSGVDAIRRAFLPLLLCHSHNIAETLWWLTAEAEATAAAVDAEQQEDESSLAIADLPLRQERAGGGDTFAQQVCSQEALCTVRTEKVLREPSQNQVAKTNISSTSFTVTQTGDTRLVNNTPVGPWCVFSGAPVGNVSAQTRPANCDEEHLQALELLCSMKKRHQQLMKGTF